MHNSYKFVILSNTEPLPVPSQGLALEGTITQSGFSVNFTDHDDRNGPVR